MPEFKDPYWITPHDASCISLLSVDAIANADLVDNMVGRGALIGRILIALTKKQSLKEFTKADVRDAKRFRDYHRNLKKNRAKIIRAINREQKIYNELEKAVRHIENKYSTTIRLREYSIGETNYSDGSKRILRD